MEDYETFLNSFNENVKSNAIETNSKTYIKNSTKVKAIAKWIANNTQIFIKFGSGIFAVILVAYFLTQLNFSASYDRNPILEFWNEYNMTAREKLNLVWKMIISNNEPEPWPSLLEQITRFFFYQTDDNSCLKLQQTFRPFSKRKIIHTQSAYARIRWRKVQNNLGYTGLFADNNIDGIISFSVAPNSFVGSFSSSFGIGVKLLRNNGLPSSFVTIFPLPVYKVIGLIGSQWNIFASGPLCTHVSFLGGLGLLIGARKQPALQIPPKFIYKYPNHIGLRNLADATINGHPVFHPRMPYAICLRPNVYLSELHKDQQPWKHPVEQLRKVPPKTFLFDVVAVDHPIALLNFQHMNNYAVKVAEIWSESEFVSSKWGDQMWFLQHQDWQLDLDARPDWRSNMNLKTLFLEGWAYLPISPPLGPSFKQFVNTWFPVFVFFNEIIFNPQFLLKFICLEVGLCRTGEFFTSIMELNDYPNNIKIHGYSTGKNESKSYFFSKDHSEEEKITFFYGQDIHGNQFHSYFNLNKSDELQTCSLNATNTYDCYLSGLKSNSNVLYKAWKTFLLDWFALNDETNSFSERSSIFPATFSTGNFVEEITKKPFKENKLDNNQLNFSVQGHYLLPTTLYGLRQILKNPSIAASIVAGISHIIKPYNDNLSSTDVEEVLHELKNFVNDQYKVSKLFNFFNDINFYNLVD